MIAVSSHRPIKECSQEIARNQIRAFESWQKVFERSVFFGPPDKALKGALFVPSKPFPKIVRLVQFCGQIPGWSVIVNADIVVSEALPMIVKRLDMAKCVCAVSWRYEFTESLSAAQVVDRGMDFFAARQEVWKEVGKIYPDEYRIGHSSWDAIMLGAFNIVAESQLYDLTAQRLIFHPRHGDRRPIFHIYDNTRTECRDNVKWPAKRLR